jgi:DNA invertase Pin-like site-specific DNA recombinase
MATASRDNLATPLGKLFYQLSGAFAEFERDTICERVRAGMRNARAKGHCIGRPSRILLTDQLRAKIAGAYQHGEGSLTAIAAHFGTSLGTVQRCVATIKTLDRR